MATTMCDARWISIALASLLLVGCASRGPHELATQGDRDPSAWQSVDAARPASWEHFTLPGKRPTVFELASSDGRAAVRADASASASMLRQKLRIEPPDLHNVRFSWKVPGLIADADMAMRDLDDSPVRIVLAFEGDTSRLSMRDRMLSELSLALTGEPMPYATLMYVWCNRRAPGSVILNPRTDRIRKLVVESGQARLNRWLDYERDIVADFERAFGEKPGALVGVAVMTDSDNTKSSATAWYGPISLHRAPLSSR